MKSRLMRYGRMGLLVLSVSVFLFTFVSTAAAQEADLVIVKNTDSTVVAAGSNVLFDVSVSNFSGVPSTPNNVLTDIIPAEMTFVSATVPDGWNCTLPTVGMGGTIECTNESAIGNESSFLFQFVFQVIPGTPNGTIITNTASIAHAGEDPNSGNDSDPASVTVGDPPPPPPPPLAPKDVLISEFRLSGAGNAIEMKPASEDDFIELYCNRSVDCDISGVSLRAYDPVQQGDFSMTFPGQTIIPARHYLLVVDSRGYTLSPYGIPDFDIALSQPVPTMENPSPPGFFFYDNEGIQLVSSGDPIVIDSVGFTGGGNDFQYVEGTGLPRAEARPQEQYGYVRKRTLVTNGLPQDTDNNAADFVLVSVNGSTHSSSVAVLGAPGPEGLSSPRSYSNSQVTANLVDPEKHRDADPNRVRVGTGDSGTLSIRRSLTNNTSDTFFYFGFRVIEITTLNSPPTLGNQADLRLISSGETSAFVPSRGDVPIFGTVLEYDNVCGCPEPKQPNGGGLNSSVFTDFSEEGSVPPGSTIDVQFLLNVIKGGAYRFYVYVNALPESEIIIGDRPAAKLKSTRTGSKTKTPRQFINVRRLQKATTIKPSKVRPPGVKSGAPIPTVIVPAPAPRGFFINPAMLEGEKKPRRKTRVRRKSSAALKKKAEEKYAAEKSQN